MSDETADKQSSATGWVIGVIVALIFYILSPGPMALLMKKGVIKESSTFTKVIDIGYWPLRKLHDNSKPVEQFYRAYFKAIGIDSP